MSNKPVLSDFARFQVLKPMSTIKQFINMFNDFIFFLLC